MVVGFAAAAVADQYGVMGKNHARNFMISYPISLFRLGTAPKNDQTSRVHSIGFFPIYVVVYG